MAGNCAVYFRLIALLDDQRKYLGKKVLHEQLNEIETLLGQYKF